jgi:hypothetical protein
VVGPCTGGNRREAYPGIGYNGGMVFDEFDDTPDVRDEHLEYLKAINKSVGVTTWLLAILVFLVAVALWHLGWFR